LEVLEIDETEVSVGVEREAKGLKIFERRISRDARRMNRGRLDEGFSRLSLSC
jgi:hypothetical protein